MIDANMRAILAKWGFKPIDHAGRILQESNAPHKQPDEETKETAKKVLSTPDVKL